MNHEKNYSDAFDIALKGYKRVAELGYLIYGDYVGPIDTMKNVCMYLAARRDLAAAQGGK